MNETPAGQGPPQAPPVATPAWMRRPERGSPTLLRLMSRLSLVLGRRLTRPVLHLITLYFMLAAPKARQASRAYLARVLPRPARMADTYRHLLRFAATIHDRVYLLSDRSALFDIRVVGLEAVHEQHTRAGGLLLLGAHLGSFEVLRHLAREAPWLKVCMAMYPENARQIGRALAAINPAAMSDLIVLGQMEAMIAVRDRLDEGALVGLLADRAAGPERYHPLPFLGTPARFPTGPFRMAAMLGRPVFFMTGLYLGGNHYEIHFEQLGGNPAAAAGGRQAQVIELLGQYVAALERHCRAAPCNWFNFFDFWHDDEHG